MAKTHDEHPRIGHQSANRSLHRLGLLTHNAFRHIRREHAVAAVNPGDVKRQRCQHPHQRLPDMPAAKNCHGLQAAVQPFCQRRPIPGRDRLETQMHHPAAALAQCGAERKTHGHKRLRRLRGRNQQRTRPGNGLVFNMAATDGAHQRIVKNSHPRASLARHRALGGCDRHAHGRLTRQPRQKFKRVVAKAAAHHRLRTLHQGGKSGQNKRCRG